MNKQEFLARLRKGLSGLPKDDVEERLAFYSEMIDDRMEEGVSEETAVRETGSVEELISQMIADIPLGKLVKEKLSPGKERRAWEIVLLVLGAPVWLPLSLAVAAVVLSLYAALWSVIVSLWAVFASFALCALAGAAAGVYFAVGGSALTGIAVLGGGLVCAGLSIFMFFACKAAAKGILTLTKKLAIRIKNCFIKKEGA